MILGTAAAFALCLAAARPSPPERADGRRAAGRALRIAIVVQVPHFAEEATTGLHVRFPGLFGLPPASFAVFVTVNVLALAIWTLSVPALRAGSRAAFAAAWFLAIADLANLALHPLAALGVGGYFPGVATSTFSGAAGFLLWIRLRAATRSSASLRSAAPS